MPQQKPFDYLIRYATPYVLRELGSPPEPYEHKKYRLQQQVCKQLMRAFDGHDGFSPQDIIAEIMRRAHTPRKRIREYLTVDIEVAVKHGYLDVVKGENPLTDTEIAVVFDVLSQYVQKLKAANATPTAGVLAVNKNSTVSNSTVM